MLAPFDASSRHDLRPSIVCIGSFPEFLIRILCLPRAMLRAAVHLRAILSVVLVFPACTDSLGPGSEPITELPRALTVAEQRVIGSANTFGLDLIREVVARDATAAARSRACVTSVMLHFLGKTRPSPLYRSVGADPDRPPLGRGEFR